MTEPLAKLSGVPLCGDETCESSSCRPEAIENWERNMTANAKACVRPWAVCDACSKYNHTGCTMPVTKGVCCCDD